MWTQLLAYCMCLFIHHQLLFSCSNLPFQLPYILSLNYSCSRPSKPPKPFISTTLLLPLLFCLWPSYLLLKRMGFLLHLKPLHIHSSTLTSCPSIERWANLFLMSPKSGSGKQQRLSSLPTHLRDEEPQIPKTGSDLFKITEQLVNRSMLIGQ